MDVGCSKCELAALIVRCNPLPRRWIKSADIRVVFFKPNFQVVGAVRTLSHFIKIGLRFHFGLVHLAIDVVFGKTGIKPPIRAFGRNGSKRPGQFIESDTTCFKGERFGSAIGIVTGGGYEVFLIRTVAPEIEYNGQFKRFSLILTIVRPKITHGK